MSADKPEVVEAQPKSRLQIMLDSVPTRVRAHLRMNVNDWIKNVQANGPFTPVEALEVIQREVDFLKGYYEKHASAEEAARRLAAGEG